MKGATRVCRNRRRKVGSVDFLAATVLVFLLGCATQYIKSKNEVRIVAVGDVLPHFQVVKAARTWGNKSNHYFGYLFEPVKSEIEKADVAIANLETPVARHEYNARKPYVFNAPVELLKGLKWAGFDLVNLANNHAYDQGIRGVHETFEAAKREGLIVLGLGRKNQPKGRIQTVKGLRLGWIGFSDLFNDEPKKPYPGALWINRLQDQEAAFKAVHDLKTRADFLTVSVHWGEEYSTEPQQRQIEMAQALADAGADLILGHHPHVLEPIVQLEAKDGRRVWVAYSLGNFISNQSSDYDPDRDSSEKGNPRDGIILQAVVDATGVKNLSVIPIWTFQGDGDQLQVRKIDRALAQERDSPKKLYEIRRKQIRDSLRLPFSLKNHAVH